MKILRQLVEWDTTAREWLTTHHHAVADAVMIGLSVLGRGGAIWIAITLALVILDRRRMRAAAVALVALTLAFALTDLVVKPVVARTRPFERSVATRVIDRRRDLFVPVRARGELAAHWVCLRVGGVPTTDSNSPSAECQPGRESAA